MPRRAVQLRFHSDDDRAILMPRLRTLVADSDAELCEDADGAQLAFDDVESPIAALIRAQILVHAACAGTDVPPIRVRRSPAA